jgi:iron(III) transport system substrate-binding protein
MLKKFLVTIFMTLIFSGLTFIPNPLIPNIMADEVNIYSARKERLIKPLLDKFNAKTGIRVNLVTGKAGTLLKRLESEGMLGPADLLLTVDAGSLARAQAAGVLQPIYSPVLDANIPANLRDPAGYWYGLSVRARTIIYAKDRVSPLELSTYEALANPKWKSRILIRSSNNIYNQSLVASMIEARGVRQTEEWARGLVANFARSPKGGDTDQLRAVAAGEGDIAIINTYYLGRLTASKKSKDRAIAEKIAVFWPNQHDRGVHINISGAAVTKSSRNKENAIKLLEFLTSDESQRWYAEANFEYPVKSGVSKSRVLESWGEFKTDNINLAVLGKNNAEAVKIMDRAGWK